MWRYLAAISLFVSVEAQAQDAGPDWQWDQSDGCAVIQRVAGSKEMLELSQSPGTDEVMVALSDSRIKTAAYQKITKISLSMEPGGDLIGDGRLIRETDDDAAKVVVDISDQRFLEAFAKTSAIAVSHEKLGVLRRAVRSPSDGVHALLECENAKLRTWGIDPKYLRALRERPRPLKPLDQLFSSDDYPPGYALNNVEGELVLRLTIGTDGKVKDCVPLNRRADRYFLQNVCGKLKLLARFQPALDQQGQVVPAPFVTAATFAMER